MGWKIASEGTQFKEILCMESRKDYELGDDNKKPGRSVFNCPLESNYLLEDLLHGSFVKSPIRISGFRLITYCDNF